MQIRDCDGTDYPEELKNVDAKGLFYILYNKKG